MVMINSWMMKSVMGWASVSLEQSAYVRWVELCRVIAVDDGGLGGQ